MSKQEPLTQWSITQSSELYGIKDWGAGFFDINEDGDVVLTPEFPDGKKGSVNLPGIIKGLKERGLNTPVLLRIENILDARIQRLNESFRNAMLQMDYQGKYQGVFPIKVNQQQQVIEEICRFGQRYNHGLEAGSKAELIAALGMIGNRESCIVCNGYKDEEFIDLGLNALKMGFRIFFVLEMPGELELILERGKAAGIDPVLGVRLKISTQAGGHWTDSGGDRSIFGLSTSQIVQVLDRLKEVGKLESLRLLHYHLGSQIPNIRDIRSAVLEASRFYADMVEEGAPMGYLDLGGGLAVDYDGSKTNYVHSRNYSLDEYTTDIVDVVKGIMDDKKVTHPTIITESGRAIVAYYSVLLFDILDTSRFTPMPMPEFLPENSHEMLVNLKEILDVMGLRNLQECYNDAIYYRDEIRQLFRHGQICLRERAHGENIFLTVMHEIALQSEKLKKMPPELEGLKDALADIYYGNFSVFQSLPDAWAIDQVFPIIPVHRLKERPSREAVLADITCDCDGKIDQFIDIHDLRKTLPVHELKEDEDYYLGAFLVGAYQETLGDLHNLLGDTNVASIRIHENGDFDFVREIEGDTIADVLSYVEYNTRDLLIAFRVKAEQSVKDGLISPAERKKIVDQYEESLRGYTYFER